MAEHAAVGLRLQAAARVVGRERVEVELLAGRGAEDEADRPMTLVQREAERTERRLDPLGAREIDDEIEILVLARLPPAQRIDAPAAVEHGVDASGVQNVEQSQHAVGGSRGSLRVAERLGSQATLGPRVKS